MRFEEMWAALAPVGRSAATGGYDRMPLLGAEREAAAWFTEECQRRDLRLESDGFGNTVAWWEPPQATGPALLTGSHLDSVRDGGAFDGPLGVVSALAAVDLLRERGVEPARRIGVGVFLEEEGSRFGLACLGSRLATGAMTWERARELRDDDGVAVGDLLAGDGSGLLDDVGCFVELHVEQGRDLVDRDSAIGVGTGIWPHGRYRFEFSGSADHAGTTRMSDRHDPMLAYATTALAARDLAGGNRATFGRLHVGPNSTNAIPSQVTAWLDARASTEAGLDDLRTAVEQRAAIAAAAEGGSVSVTTESVSGAVDFDTELPAHPDWPRIPTAAGHDAGILSAAGIPTAMLFVRNPTGVSHSPAEHASMDDCLAGVEALAAVVAELAQ